MGRGNGREKGRRIGKDGRRGRGRERGTDRESEPERGRCIIIMYMFIHPKKGIPTSLDHETK